MKVLYANILYILVIFQGNTVPLDTYTISSVYSQKQKTVMAKADLDFTIEEAKLKYKLEELKLKREVEKSKSLHLLESSESETEEVKSLRAELQSFNRMSLKTRKKLFM